MQVGQMDKQVFKGIELPLEGIATALVSTIVIYITGNQIALSSGAKSEDTKESPEKTN